MTFYEAALEVLRREGAPLHFQRITELALDDNLLSHVGRMPEAIMQARLAAMARRAEDRQVVVVEPGVFALTDWGVAHDDAAAAETAPRPPEAGTPLRRNERTPITLQDAKAVRDAERNGKFEAEDREARQRGRRRRYQPKGDASPVEVLEGLLSEVGGGPIDLTYLVDAADAHDDLPEGSPADLEAFRSVAEQENVRRVEEGGVPRFLLEGDRIDRIPEPAGEEPAPSAEAVRPRRRPEAVSGVAKALVQALGGLKPAGVEALALALGEHFGLTDVKVAKRSAKGSPLFTGFVRPGVGQLRVAVRVLVRGRDVRPDDVDEVRADLDHYSAAGGVIVTTGRADRQARSRVEDMSQKPVAVLDGEALARLCIRAGIGVRVHLEEALEADPASLKAFGTRK